LEKVVPQERDAILPPKHLTIVKNEGWNAKGTYGEGVTEV
jgi:hypothetical protein